MDSDDIAKLFDNYQKMLEGNRTLEDKQYWRGPR